MVFLLKNPNTKINTVKRAWRASQSLNRGDYHSGLFDPKRSGSRGFHEGIFDEGFGGFSTLKRKRRPEMTSRGIHGDAFTGRRDLGRPEAERF